MHANIIIDDNDIQAALHKLVEAGGNTRGVMKQIGEYLTASTRDRFNTSTAPDGSRWQENSEVALINHLRKTKGNFKKRGGLSSKGKKRASRKKPLIGESKSLSGTINYTVYNWLRSGVEIGSPMQYAATHQFGAKRGAFGKTARGAPIPWGDIPARPFVGLSAADRREVLAIIEDHIKGALK